MLIKLVKNREQFPIKLFHRNIVRCISDNDKYRNIKTRLSILISIYVKISKYFLI